MNSRNFRITLISFCAFLFAYSHSLAQSTTTFQKCYNTNGYVEYASSVLSLPDEGFLISGIAYDSTSQTGQPTSKILIIRTDSLGRKKWSKTFSGTGAGNCATGNVNGTALSTSVDMILTPGGNIVVCSNTFNETAIYLFEITLSGAVIWSKTFPSANKNVVTSGMCIMNDPKGGYIITGVMGIVSAHEEAIVIKTDSAGIVVWSNIYYRSNYQGCGFRITPARDGGYLVCGISHNDLSNNQFGYPANYLIMKIDKNGNLLWSNVYGDSANNKSANSIVELPDKSIYVCGEGSNQDKENAGTLIKLDSAGKLLWSKIYVKGTSGTDGKFRSVLFDSAKKVFNISYEYAGSLEKAGIIRLDTSGNVVFIKSYGSLSMEYWYRSVGHNLLPLKSGGFVLLQHAFEAGLISYYLVKMDSGANTHNCNTLPFSKSVVNYPLNYLYSDTSTNISLNTGSGCIVTSFAVNDSFMCPPFAAEFSWVHNCPGYGVQFYDSSYNRPISWKWNFGDPNSGSNTSTSQNPSHTYSGPGLYKVMLSSTNGDLKNTTSKTVIILQPPAPFVLDTLVCSGDSLHLNARPAGATYLWNDSDTAGTRNVPVGTWWVKVSVINSCPITDTIHVFDPNLVKINLGNDTTICEGDTLTLNAGYVSTVWSTGENGPTIKLTRAGKYWAVIKGGNCAVSDTILVNINKINLGNDTSICQGDSLILRSGYPGALWSTGAKGLSIKVIAAGKYWARVGNICPVSDTINIGVKPRPIANLGGNKTSCTKPVVLSPSTDTGVVYEWSTGSATKSITVDSSGKYWVQISKNGCSSSDTVLLKVVIPPTVNLVGNNSTCDTFVILDPGQNPGAAYFWSTHDTSTTIVVTTSGKYWVMATRNTCMVSDTAIVTFLKRESFGSNNLNDIVFCSDDSVLILDAGFANNYLWSPGGDTTEKITITSAGTYTVQISGADGCTASKTISITDDCSPGFYVPNAFSPDSNGHNEIFKAYGVHIATFSMRIYNRWDEKLYSGNNINEGWDGKFKGSYCTNGMYVYDINYSTVEAPGTIIKRSGIFYLLR